MLGCEAGWGTVEFGSEVSYGGWEERRVSARGAIVRKPTNMGAYQFAIWMLTMTTGLDGDHLAATPLKTLGYGPP